MLLGATALSALRLILSFTRSGPVIMADEAGYLMNARVLAGGMPANMGSSPFYRGGYALLLAPVVGLGGDPVSTYHAVLVVNVLLSAAVVPLLYLLVTRFFGASQWVGVWAALAAAAYPAVTATSQVAMSENLLFPLTLAWLLCAGGLLRALPAGRALPWAVAAAACSTSLWAVHGRMVVAVALTGLLLSVLVVRRAHAAAAAGVAVLVAGLGAARLLNNWLVEHSYAGRRTSDVGSALSSLTDPGSVLRNLVGQGWYLLIATFGIALVFLVGAVPGALRRARRGQAEPNDHLTTLLAAMTGGLLVLSSLWLAEATRPDQLIYGRYVEPVVPALLAVGVVLVSRAPRLPQVSWLAGALVTLTGIVAVLRSKLDVPGIPSRWNVAALPSITDQLQPLVLVVAGAVATAALCLLFAAQRRKPALVGPLLLALMLPTSAYVAYLPVLRSQHDVYPSAWTSPRAVIEATGVETVAYDLDHFDHVAVKVYQWFLPQTRFILFHSTTEAPPARLVFSGRSFSGRLGADAEAIWVDPGRDQRLWDLGPNPRPANS